MFIYYELVTSIFLWFDKKLVLLIKLLYKLLSIFYT